MVKRSSTAELNAIVGVAVNKHSLRLRRFVSRRVQNPHDAEDITQDTFEKFAQSVNENVAQENLLACLLQIAKCKIAEFWERQAKDRAYIEWTDDMERLVENVMVANSGLYQTGDLEEREQRLQMLHQIKTAVDRMSPRLSAALVLHVQGWSSRQIAERLGMNEDAVRKNICRARKALAELFQE